MDKNVSVAIIGFGRMGRAIAVGLVKAGFEKNNIHVYDKLLEARKIAMDMRLKVFDEPQKAVAESDIVIVAVKPGDVQEAVRSIANYVKGKAVVSVAALTPLKKLEELLPNTNVYRAMPNILVEFNKGFIALAPQSRRSDLVEEVFRLLGDVEWVDEHTLDLLTFYSASTPAVVAEIYDSFILSALRAGLPHSIAKKAISSVFQGVAQALLEKSVTELRDSVITPGGVTIRIIEKLYVDGAKQLLLKALNEAFKEYQELIKGLQ